MVSDLPRQGSLRRLRDFDVRPNRQLGQNFLIDDNLLRVIADAAELDPADVVLEVGGGLGVLSEHLAPLVGHLHVVEVDRALEPALRDALAPFANTSSTWRTPLELDLAAWTRRRPRSWPTCPTGWRPRCSSGPSTSCRT